MWVNDNKPGEMHCIFVWESIESWRKVDDKEVQAALIARFESKFQHPSKPVSYTHLDVYKRQTSPT